MKLRLFFLLLLTATVSTLAEAPKGTPGNAPKATPAKAVEPAPTPPRKTLTFQPGAKTPDEVAASKAATLAVVPPGADESMILAGAFFASLEKNQIEEAYTNLCRGSKIGDRPDELRNLKAKTSEAITLFGEVRGFESVETKVVGSALRRYTFISFGRDFPLRWRFYFYLTDGHWRLIDLHVDDRLSGIFEETETVAVAEQKQ